MPVQGLPDIKHARRIDMPFWEQGQGKKVMLTVSITCSFQNISKCIIIVTTVEYYVLYALYSLSHLMHTKLSRQVL
jgi:hypothetical protein